MKKNHFSLFISVFAILFAMIACVLPGQTAQPASDPNAIGTAIAGTSQAAMQQTLVAQLSTVTPEGPTGMMLETLPDGSTKYTDYDAGFEVIFPVGWLAVRPNSDEFNAALSGEGAVNSMLHDQMTVDQVEAADYRLLGYILRPDIKQNVIFGFSRTSWDPDDSAMLDNANMGELVRGLESQTDIPGFRVDVAQIYDDGNTRVIEVGGRWSLNDGTSNPIPFYSVFFFFKPTQDSTVRVTITILQDYQDDFAADVESIKDSIRVIKP